MVVDAPGRVGAAAAVRGMCTQEGAGSTSTSKPGFFDRESYTADKEFDGNRWLMVLPAFFSHLAIGSPYAWSAISPAVGRELGVVAQAAADWSLAEMAMPMSIAFLMQGVAAAIGGAWQNKVGPRQAMMVAAGCFGGGLMLGGAGVAMHSLPLLYAGYGLLAGTGVGLGYTPPLQTLLTWLPDKKGIASGLTIAGFGSGPLVFGPAVQALAERFAKDPTFLGAKGAVDTVTRDGRLFALVHDGPAAATREVEAVLASSADLAEAAMTHLQPGLYQVGTGSTGAGAALATMGVGYLGLMTAAALAVRVPHPEWQPPGLPAPAATNDKDVAETSADGKALATQGNVHFSDVMKTPQYWQMATLFFGVACGSMGMMSVAKPMMSEVFSGILPGLVTASFASSYLMALSAGNLGGRLVWAGLSDVIGRRNMFHVFAFGSIPIFLSVPYLVDSVVQSGESAPLYAFVLSSTLAVSFMGGTYAILPAYESDMFGTKYVGANHGRMLLASSAASMAGPMTLQALRGREERAAIDRLVEMVDPAAFQAAFGANKDSLNDLIAAKSVTIRRLLEVAPANTPDPSPYLYDSTMYTAGGLVAVAALAHASMRPVNPAHFEENKALQAAADGDQAIEDDDEGGEGDEDGKDGEMPVAAMTSGGSNNSGSSSGGSATGAGPSSTRSGTPSSSGASAAAPVVPGSFGEWPAEQELLWPRARAGEQRPPLHSAARVVEAEFREFHS